MTNLLEHPLDDDAAGVFRFSSRRCTDLFGISEDADPKKIVYALDALADAWQQGTRPPPEVLDEADAAYVLGSAWADQLARALGWQWCVLHEGEGDKHGTPASVSPDRSLAIYPFRYLESVLSDPTKDVTIALAFNMIAGGHTGKRPAGGLFDVMGGVKRVVPRR